MARRESYLQLSWDDYDLALIPRRPVRYGGLPALLGGPGVLADVKRRLIEGETARSISDRLGYSQPSAFTNAFVKAVGEPPSKFASRFAGSKLDPV